MDDPTVRPSAIPFFPSTTPPTWPLIARTLPQCVDSRAANLSPPSPGPHAPKWTLLTNAPHSDTSPNN
ncbi:hypothetical protein KC319_g43 [Hortaea werneckii]|nr:hypothetical protein KC319_g43 [Hortaea werneckii]